MYLSARAVARVITVAAWRQLPRLSLPALRPLAPAASVAGAAAARHAPPVPARSLRAESLSVARRSAHAPQEVGAGALPRHTARIAFRLAVARLVLLAEVTAAGLVAVEGVDGEQFAELEVVGEAQSQLERLIEVVPLAGHADVLPVLVALGPDRVARCAEAV